MDRGEKQVTAANDMHPHTTKTVTEPGSFGEKTFLWSLAEKVKEYKQGLGVASKKL